MPPHDDEQTLTLPVKYLIKRPPVFVDSVATVGQAAVVMRDAGIGSVLVADEPPGIITDRDLRSRVLAAGRGPETLVAEVMTRPLKTLDSDAPVFTALRLMLEENVHHMPLVEEGKIVGLISGKDLLRHEGNRPFYLRRTLDHLEAPAKLQRYSREIAGTVQTLFRGGVAATQIGQIVSSLNDALVKRLVNLAMQALGPPAADFAWIVFGSEGRSEQMLLTDQDNALIYGEESTEAQIYFATLAKRVVDGLIEVGFPPCPGGFMATNWCKPIREWQRLFASWIRTPEPQALLDAVIFFDFRVVGGTLQLQELEELVSGAGQEKLFVAHLARSALELRPPLGFFNRVRSDRGMVDLKLGGIGPIVGLARLGALAAGSLERSTMERLVVAGESGTILSKEESIELAETFRFLMQLRLRRQLEALQGNKPLDHKVHLDSLSTLERRHLKEAFIMIREIQDDVRALLHIEQLG